MICNNIPIIEYDDNPIAIIQPDKSDYKFCLPEKCMAIFFKDIFEKMQQLDNVKELGRVTWETGDVVYYLFEFEEDGKSFAFYHSWVGAPISASVMDLTIALGAKSIISLGGCGVINKNLIENNVSIVLPREGIRDEGTSFHYIKPSQSVKPSSKFLVLIEDYLKQKKINYKTVKTWTTDGFYRETNDRTNRRKNQGCDVVEMEFSAMCAVAQKREIQYAALFYCGDSVENNAYDERNWQNNYIMRNNLFNIAMNILSGGI